MKARGAQIKFVTLLFNQLKCVKTHDAGTDRVEFFCYFLDFLKTHSNFSGCRQNVTMLKYCTDLNHDECIKLT